MDDNECNKERLHEELCNKIISTYKISNEADTANDNDIEHDDEPKSTDEL